MTVNLNNGLSKNSVNFGSIAYVKGSRDDLSLLNSMLKLAKQSGDFSYQEKDTLEISHSDLAVAGLVNPKCSGGENWLVIGTDDDAKDVGLLRRILEAKEKNKDNTLILKGIKTLTMNTYDAFKTLTGLKK